MELPETWDGGGRESQSPEGAEIAWSPEGG